MSSEISSIAVVGPGAVGTLFAAKLSAAFAQIEVRLLGRAVPGPETRAHLDAIARAGIRVEGEEGYAAHPETGPPRAGEKAGLILVAVPAGMVADAARDFSSLVGPGTITAVLSNGLDVCGDFPADYPRERLVRGLVGAGAEIGGPGRVSQFGKLALALAPPPGAGPPPGAEAGMDAVETLAALFRRAGIEVEVHADGRKAEWRKAVVNAVINPLGAVFGLRNGEILEKASVYRIFEALSDEAQRVLDAEGVDVDVLEQARAAALATAGNRNSMWQALAKGRRTEVEEVTGRLIRCAEKAGVAVPSHRVFMRSVRDLERKRVSAPAGTVPAVDTGRGRN